METKFIELEGLSGKHIINVAHVSSVHETSDLGAKYLTVKITDGSVIYVDMDISDFYKLLNE